ncbi:somatostatin receptor type 4-like [Glandiceps talaboti]
MTAIANVFLSAFDDRKEQMAEDCILSDERVNFSGIYIPDGNFTYELYLGCNINFYLMVTLLITFGLAGLIGNGLFLFVVIRVKSMRTLPNYFVINLAVADIVCLSSLCIYPLLAAIGEKDNLYLTELRTFMMDIATFTSITTVMLITVDRYIAICRPLLAPRIQRKSRARFLVALSWITGIGLGLIEYVLVNVSQFQVRAASLFLLLTFLIYTSFVLLVVLLLYMMIIKRLMCQSNTVRRLPFRRKREYRNETKVLIMCSVVVILFLICFGPLLITLFMAPAVLLLDTYPSPLFYNCVNTVTPLMVVVNFALNPFLYNAPSNRHRLAFRRAFVRPKRRNGELEMHGITTARTTMNSSHFSEARQTSRQ